MSVLCILYEIKEDLNWWPLTYLDIHILPVTKISVTNFRLINESCNKSEQHDKKEIIIHKITYYYLLLLYQIYIAPFSCQTRSKALYI